MEIRRLEYGEKEGSEYAEDFNSFKVYEVWSQPDVEFVEAEGLEMEELDDDEEIMESSKRLAVAVELSMSQGGYLFIEKPTPNPEWLENVFDLLRKESWQGHRLQEIRDNCRGEITVIERTDYTAVIDREKNKVFHNRAKIHGESKIEELEDFEPENLTDILKGYILEVDETSSEIKIRLEDGEKIWLKSQKEVSGDLIGKTFYLTILVIPETELYGNKTDIEDQTGIKSMSEERLKTELVAEVSDYDVGDKWPEAENSRGYPLVELGTGLGKVVIAHENIPPVEDKQAYHQEGTKWKVVADRLILKDFKPVS